jgi:hypothetical protein
MLTTVGELFRIKGQNSRTGREKNTPNAVRHLVLFGKFNAFQLV